MSRVTRHLKECHWKEMQILYQTGESVRNISQKFDISHTTVWNKIKKENWQRDLITRELDDIRNQIAKLSKIPDPEQLDQLGNILKQDIDEIFLLTKTLTNLQKGALNLHGMILKDTLTKMRSGDIKAIEASRIAQAQGLTVDKIASMAGISKENPATAVQINNNLDKADLSNLSPIEASFEYQKLIK